MYCKKCGSPIPDDSRFCNYCGTSVSPVVQQPTVPQSSMANQQAPQNPMANQQVPQSQFFQQANPQPPVPKKKKKKTGLIILILVLVVLLAAGAVGAMFLLNRDKEEKSNKDSTSSSSITNPNESTPTKKDSKSKNSKPNEIESSDKESVDETESSHAEQRKKNSSKNTTSDEKKLAVINYYTAILNGDVDAMMNLVPDNYLDYMIETYDIDKDAVKNELQTLMKDELADWEDNYGTNIKLNVHFNDEEVAEQSEVDELNDQLEESGWDFTITEGYTYSVDVTFNGDDDEYTETYDDVAVLKVDGKWFNSDAMSMITDAAGEAYYNS